MSKLDDSSAPLYFILGPSYHGASGLSLKLNAHHDILSLGSGNPLRNEDQPCSCGQPVSSCPFWTAIAEKTGREEDDPFDTLLPQSPFLAGSKILNIWLNSALSLLANEAGPKCWKITYEQAKRFMNTHEAFFSAAKTLAPYKMYVDAERSNIKFMTMASMEFPVKGVIHLVRDPRGYVAAWKKYYPESTVEKLTLEWVAAHTRIARLKQFFPKVPFMTVRYEDMVSDSDATMEKIAGFLNLDQGALAGASEIAPDKNHLIGLGPREQVADPAAMAENWRESLGEWDQKRVIRAAGPLFAEFGYKT